MTTYFIADQHFGRPSALEHNKRPFDSVEECDTAMIERWNAVVNNDDDVYILGDIGGNHNVEKIIPIIKQLKGNKHLIIGNYDIDFIKNKEFKSLFVNISDYEKIDIGYNRPIVLSHYPIIFFDGWGLNSYHLYGHVHNNKEWDMIEAFKSIIREEYTDLSCCMYNVGACMGYMNYTPQTLEHIVNTCEGKPFVYNKVNVYTEPVESDRQLKSKMEYQQCIHEEVCNPCNIDPSECEHYSAGINIMELLKLADELDGNDYVVNASERIRNIVNPSQIV